MRKWKQRLWSLLLCAALAAGLCPTALAEDGDIPYLDENGEEQFCKTYTAVTQDVTEWRGGWYVAQGTSEFTIFIAVYGDVHLILADNCSLTAKNGIILGEGSSLTIYAQSDSDDMGSLLAKGERAADAAIRVSSGSTVTINGGKITVSGGTVNATGVNGAGIGGGYSGGGGEIAINGGIVKVKSYGGADIGGGCGGADGGIVPSDKIEISKDDIVTRPDGKPVNIGSAEHEANDEWVSDGAQHWHPCKAADCNEHQFNKAAHSFGDWTIDQAATSSTAGIRHRVCGTCQYTQTETTPPLHSHSYGPAWKSNAAGHWHECSCGDKSGYAPHTPGDWIVDQGATTTETGSRHRECTVCGYTTQTEAIPATGGDGGGGGGSSGGRSYAPPTYKPDVPQPSEGGSVSVSPSSPERGDTVTVKPRPDEGYAVEKITVTGPNGKSVEVTKKPDGTYTFTQPGGKVKIEVTYQRMETPWNNPFSDVSESDWCYEAVKFVQEGGLMNGYSDGRFGADDTLSRAQLAQILFNKEGRPGADSLPDFSDVAGEAWYAGAVRWAAGQGIVGGYGNGTFGPNDPITREQLAVMLWRYSGSPAATNEELNFNDEAEIGGYAQEALRWAVENGILNGYGDGRLNPKGQATRAQVAQMLKNFIENLEEDN